MPRIYVEFSRLDQIGDSCKSVASKVNAIQEDFQCTVRQLDWDVRFESNINSTATQLSRKLEQYSQALETYQQFIEDAYKEYKKIDEYKQSSSLKIIGTKSITFSVLGPGGNPFADGNLILTEKLKKYFSTVNEEKDLLSTNRKLHFLLFYFLLPTKVKAMKLYPFC